MVSGIVFESVKVAGLLDAVVVGGLLVSGGLIVPAAGFSSPEKRDVAREYNPNVKKSAVDFTAVFAADLVLSHKVVPPPN